MTELTFKDIENKVRELAGENPDFVYKTGPENWGCKYTPDQTQPGCLFGQAFIALGKPVPSKLEGRGILGVLTEFDIENTDEQALWAADVQGFQDKGREWGFAISEADNLKRG